MLNFSNNFYLFRGNSTSICKKVSYLNIFKRSMKRYTNKNLLSNSQNQTYLTDNLLRIIESLYTSKINNKYDYLDRLVKIYSIPSENITVQSLLLGITPKFSTKKENYYSAY